MSKSSSTEHLHWNAAEQFLDQRPSGTDSGQRLSLSWPAGPRTVILQRCDRGYGFTLRHFIVYPPDFPKDGNGSKVSDEEGGRGGGGGDQQSAGPLEPMDTIFVKHVKEGGPAQKAGLHTGDRIVSVNGETVAGKSYSHVVQIIQRSGNILQLLVVPKEDDILQLYFPGTAYRSSPECQQQMQDVTSSGSASFVSSESNSQSNQSAQSHISSSANNVGVDMKAPSCVADLNRRRFSELPSFRAEVASVLPSVGSVQGGSTWSVSNAVFGVALGSDAESNSVGASHRSKSICNLSPMATAINRPYVSAMPTSGYIAGIGYNIGRPPWAAPSSSSLDTAIQPPAREYNMPPPFSQASKYEGAHLNAECGQPRESFNILHDNLSLPSGTPPPSLSTSSSREPSLDQSDLPESIISRLRATFEKKEEFLLRTTPSASTMGEGTNHKAFSQSLYLTSSSSSIPGSGTAMLKDSSNQKSWPQLSVGSSGDSEMIGSGQSSFSSGSTSLSSMSVQSTTGTGDSDDQGSARHAKTFVSNLSRIQENIPTTETRKAGDSRPSQIRTLGDGCPILPIPPKCPSLAARHLLKSAALRKASSLDSEMLPSNGLGGNNGGIGVENDGSTISMDTVAFDDLNGTSLSAVHLVSRRARQFELGAVEREATLRMNLYKNELARMTTRGQTPRVSDRAARFESLSTSQETIGSESDHCPSPREKNTANKSNGNQSHLFKGNDDLKMAINKDHVFAADVSLAEEDDEEACRHKAMRQNSYLTAVKTPYKDCNLSLEGGSFPDSRFRPTVPNFLPLNTMHIEGCMSAPATPGAWVSEQSSTSPMVSFASAMQGLNDSLDFDCMMNRLMATSDRSMFFSGSHMPDNGGPPPSVSAANMAGSTLAAGVVLRRKAIYEDEAELADDGRTVRRVSYLRATSGEPVSKESEAFHSDEHKQHHTEHSKGSAIGSRSQSIQKLKAFFGERTPNVVEASERRPLREFPDNSQTSPESFKEGWLHCKVATIDGKRAPDRSWKQMWVVLRDSLIYLYKDKKDVASQTFAVVDENFVELKCCRVDVASDYTKKKHVFRLTTSSGSEYLIQADSSGDMQRWIKIIRENLDGKSVIKQGMVLRKSALFEREIGRISPQPGPKGIRKLTTFRNRSPTGHSPTSKSRKSSQGDDMSPKSKTWRGKMVKTIRKIHGTSPTSTVQPEGVTVGVPLEDCPPSSVNEFVPLLIELCTSIVEAKGLDVIGIYRVPGNTAAVSFLLDAVNHGFECLNLQDPKWNDVNVISSLLKAFFRKLPEPLVTAELYPLFIEASKFEDPVQRLYALRKMLHELPDHNYETLKFLVGHLRKVVAHSNVNKMEARNLAIVFGPTLVRAADDNMVTMVTDMSYQCRIVEMLITNGEWFFSGDENEDVSNQNLFINGRESESSNRPISNQNLLLNNVQKVGHSHVGEVSKAKDLSAKDLVSSIIGAANRKVKQKMKKHTQHSHIGVESGTEERDIDREIELRLRMMKPKAAGNESVVDGEQKQNGGKSERRHSEDSSTSSIRTTFEEFCNPRKMSMDSLDSLHGVPLRTIVGSRLAANDRERMFCVVRQPISRRPIWNDSLSENEPYTEQNSAVENSSLSDTVSEQEKLGDEVILRNYPILSNNMQDRIKRFELETKALLQRDLHKQRRDGEQRELDRQRIELEWQRAKKDLEHDDFLDELADNPMIAKKVSDITNKIRSLYPAGPLKALAADPSSVLVSSTRPITDGTLRNVQLVKPTNGRTSKSASSTQSSSRPRPPVGSSKFESDRGPVPPPRGHHKSPRAAMKRVSSVESFVDRPHGGLGGFVQGSVQKHHLESGVKSQQRTGFINGDKSDWNVSNLQPSSNLCGSLDSLREFYETTKENQGGFLHENSKTLPCESSGSGLRNPLWTPIASGLSITSGRSEGPPVSDVLNRHHNLVTSQQDVHFQRNENTLITATLSTTMHTISTTSTTAVMTATIVSEASIPSTLATSLIGGSPLERRDEIEIGAKQKPFEGQTKLLQSSSFENGCTKGKISPPHVRKSSHLRNLKRRHTVGGTKDFEKFRLLVGSQLDERANDPSMDVKRQAASGSAWERLCPAVSHDGTVRDRSMKSWLQRERLRTSSPDLHGQQGFTFVARPLSATTSLSHFSSTNTGMEVDVTLESSEKSGGGSQSQHGKSTLESQSMHIRQDDKCST